MSKRAKSMEADVRLNFEMWKAARDIAISCDERLKESEVRAVLAMGWNAGESDA